MVCVTRSMPTFAKWHIDSDRKKIASVTFSLPLLCFPCDWTRCFPSRLAARTIVRNSRVRTTATTVDVLAGRRPRDGYDIAGNRYAISRAIHARVIPNTNGIWIYPDRPAVNYTQARGLAVGKQREPASGVSRFYTSYLSDIGWLSFMRLNLSWLYGTDRIDLTERFHKNRPLYQNITKLISI